MSDKIVLVAMFCITTLGMAAIVFISTYLKDKLTIKNKTSIKDDVKSETEITAEKKDSKD
ncbi:MULTISPECIES: hypothetical protein [Clostridium]|uniref:hypothetical protein n=1 Tax=Clostridium TaxID=1485 RepID=UPI001FA8133F|nr:MULTISPECIES: hypothetical protein [Clostridium]